MNEPKPAELLTPQPTEEIPATAGGLSALASAMAPFVYFDEAPISASTTASGKSPS